MTPTEHELERIADEIYLDRRITSSLYCGACGYNLKGLPVIHKCPECGNAYNGRPLKMDGIFQPYTVEFPFGDVFGSVLGTILTVAIGYKGVNPVEPNTLWIAGCFGVVTLLLFVQTYGRLKRYIKSTIVARRIAAQEHE